MRGLRELQLRKSPSISETIDWARTLSVLGVAELSATALADTANVVLKYERDVRHALDALPGLLDPNRELPDPRDGHGHDHTHERGHTHTHRHENHVADLAAGDEAADMAEGRAARTDMYRPGRHDVGYYGAPTSGPRRPSEARDGKDRGARSFAALTRRRPG